MTKKEIKELKVENLYMASSRAEYRSFFLWLSFIRLTFLFREKFLKQTKRNTDTIDIRFVVIIIYTVALSGYDSPTFLPRWWYDTTFVNHAF